MPAHPDYEGLCYSHGTFDNRASRQDNLQRELAALAASSSTEQANLGYRALSRAVIEGRISPHRASVLLQIRSILQQSRRCSLNDDFACARGPQWERLHQLIDELAI